MSQFKSPPRPQSPEEMDVYTRPEVDALFTASLPIAESDVTGLVADLAALAAADITLPIAESDVTSLVADLAAKAPLNSPTFTGVPILPDQTQVPGIGFRDGGSGQADWKQLTAAALWRIVDSGYANVNLSVAEDTGNLIARGSATAKTLVASGTIAKGSVSGAQTITLTAGQGCTATATGAITWTFASAPSGCFGFILLLTNGGAGVQTWPTSVKWPGGTAPTLQAAGVDLLGFATLDGGTTWYGSTPCLAAA